MLTSPSLERDALGGLGGLRNDNKIKRKNLSLWSRTGSHGLLVFKSFEGQFGQSWRAKLWPTSFRLHIEFSSVSLRPFLCHFGFTPISLRTHVDVTSVSLRCHFDFTSMSIRVHFESNVRSMETHIDVASM